MPKYRDEKLQCSAAQKADLEIANQQSVVEYLAYLVDQNRTRITESDVLEIHRLTIAGIYPCAGTYRDVTKEILITGTRHRPSEASMIRADMTDMLEWHYGPEGQKQDPLTRAARLLWRINSIHPFSGGNGRVARAVAYLSITLEMAPLFAGEPLPAKLKKQKQRYIRALKAADKGDLSPMKELITECVSEQIEDAVNDLRDGLKHPNSPTPSQARLFAWIGRLTAKIAKVLNSGK